MGRYVDGCLVMVDMGMYEYVRRGLDDMTYLEACR